MIRFKAMPTEKPEDTSAAKASKASKTKGKVYKAKTKKDNSASEQDLLDLPSEAEEEKD